MKILSWNCKEISHPAVVCGLRALITTNSPDVLSLSDTKFSPSLVCPILNHLAFYLMTHVAHSGTCGGLVLAWRLGVELESFISNKNNISAWCYFDPPNSPWFLSYIYGPSKEKNKLAFWDSLTTASEAFVSPWLCIGDFNFVLDQSEKLGGCHVASSSHCPFRNFIDHHGLVDLGFVGNPYTWFNNMNGFATIKERLDRTLASLDWVHLYPKPFLFHF
jgi:exonuclease III